MPLDEGTFEIDRNELDRLYATIERMRKVLEFVEHGGRLTAGYECPCCGQIGSSTGIVHLTGCDLGAALGRPECGESKGDDHA